jgi:hypothetical protein
MGAKKGASEGRYVAAAVTQAAIAVLLYFGLYFSSILLTSFRWSAIRAAMPRLTSRVVRSMSSSEAWCRGK